MIRGLRLAFTFPLEPKMHIKNAKWLDRIRDWIASLREYIDAVAFSSSDPLLLQYIRVLVPDSQTILTKPEYPYFSDNRIFDIIANREALRKWFCQETNFDILAMIDSDMFCPRDETLKIINHFIDNEISYLWTKEVGAFILMRRYVACSIRYISSVFYPSYVRTDGLEKLTQKEPIYLEEHYFVMKQMEFFNYWCERHIGRKCIKFMIWKTDKCIHKDCPPGKYMC